MFTEYGFVSGRYVGLEGIGMLSMDVECIENAEANDQDDDMQVWIGEASGHSRRWEGQLM